jgi:hypothetical protein
MDSYLLNKNNVSRHVVEHQQTYLLGAGRVKYQDRSVTRLRTLPQPFSLHTVRLLHPYHVTPSYFSY